MPVTSGQHDPQHVRDLGGGPERELIAHRSHTTARGSIAHGDQPLLPVGALDHHGRVAERSVHVALGEDPLEGLVACLVHLRRALGQGLHVQHRGQRLVVDVDQLQGVRRGVPVAGHHAATVSPT